MTSIRRVLILYFLLLMGASLGVVGLLVRHEVAVALESRAAADGERIAADAARRVRDRQEQFDKDLIAEARVLGRDFQNEHGRGGSPGDQMRPALFGGLTRGIEQLHPLPPGSEVVKTFDPDDHASGTVFQITVMPRSGGGPVVVWRPSNVPFALPVGEGTADGGPQFDDRELPGLGACRLATFRAPPGRPRGPRPPAGERGGSFVYGHSLASLESELARITDERDAKLARLPLKAADDLRAATGTLALVAGGCLVLLPVGGWLLVGRGLRSLHVLTAALSRVSERDFRLPVAASELSTELAPIHDRLTRTLDALRRAFEREKEAVGDISHELRTPLAALSTTIDVALRKPRDATFYRDTLTDCRDITKQMSRLVDRILTLATLDAGETPSWTPVNVAELAAGCATLIRPLAEGHGIRLDVALDPAARSTTDPHKLREVLLNLLHNAVEYNRPGGEITLGVTCQEQGVSVTVSDTGIGMTPDVRAKIFERFYRADPSRHATGVHAGLGLAIVKEYVERLNGRIAVTSTPGEGSRFEVAIPAVAG